MLLDIRCISLVNLFTSQRRLRGRDVVAQVIMVFWETFSTDQLKFAILSWKFELCKTSAAQNIYHNISFKWIGQYNQFSLKAFLKTIILIPILLKFGKFDFYCGPPILSHEALILLHCNLAPFFLSLHRSVRARLRDALLALPRSVLPSNRAARARNRVILV